MNNDHDILIEVRTILASVVDDFRAYRMESHKAISSLEAKCAEIEKNKVSIVDYVKHVDGENMRLSRIEKLLWMLMGAVVVVQFLAPVIIDKIFK